MLYLFHIDVLLYIGWQVYTKFGQFFHMNIMLCINGYYKLYKTVIFMNTFNP